MKLHRTLRVPALFAPFSGLVALAGLLGAAGLAVTAAEEGWKPWQFGENERYELVMTDWSSGDAKAATALVTDAMVDATGIAGTPEQCRARIEAYRASGIDLPIISPFARGPGAKAAFEAAIKACAPG